MKKLFTIFAAAACAFGAYAADTVFSADLTAITADDFKAWTVFDANSDEKTWTCDEASTPSHVFYSYHSANVADDWLITPAITIPADGSYVLSYEFSGSSYGEAFEVWTGTAPTIEDMTEKIADHPEVNADVAGNLAFADLKAGTVHFAFHCTSQPDRFRLYINSVKLLSADNPVDLRVSDITSPVSGEGLGQEKVTVLIENAGRIDVASYDVAYSVNGGDPVIEHISEPLAIGEKREYTFAAPADLSLGHFTHVIKAWTINDDDINPANDSFETKVKHIAPAVIPYRMGFEPDEDTSMMTYLNLNEDDGDWSINIGGGWLGNFARTGYGCLAYNYNKENAADDWAILESVEMEAGYYALKFWYSATENHKERMRVYYGSAPTPEAMTNLIAEYDSVDNIMYEEAIHIFKIENAGPVYIGFYCYSDADENWLFIDDLSIDKVDPDKFDLIVNDFVTPTSVMREGSLTDIRFSVRNVGIIDAEVTLNAYLDDQKVASAVYTVRGQENLPVIMEKAIEGITEGKHTVRVEAVCDGDTDLENNTLMKEVVVMGDAVKLWDFEDGVLPDDITFRKEDLATDHPDAGAEFNEDGFGIFSLEHFLLGTKALAVNTWFTDNTTADRWIVLPQMTVTGENAYFVWNANSYNPSYPEKYEISISESEDNWYSYTSVMSVPAESTSPQTRGINLADYNGKTIYIAIHVRTSGGEALILDNLGVYGDIVTGAVGIDNIANDKLKAVVEGDMLRVYGTDSASVTILDINGRQMLASEALNTDISALESGVYVARVNTSAGLTTVKFVR